MARPTLLFIDHPFHLKSQSSVFLKEMLEKNFDVEYLTTQMDCFLSEASLCNYADRKFDFVCCLQVMPSIKILKKYVTFGRGIFFPMADYYYGILPWNMPIWREYQDFKIISFSKKVHEELRAHGFDSEYIQYFPKPEQVTEWGDSHGVYFWQRITHLNIYRILEVLKGQAISHVHIHKAMDPGEQYMPLANTHKEFSMTYSVWYKTRQDMKRDMMKYAVYVAPRPVEGIGMGFLEAMAAGRCVVANDNTTHNEYIEHGKTGILYDLHGKPPDVSSCDIRTIQKNAYQYICDGYKKWTVAFADLVTHFSLPLKNDPALLKKNENTWTHAVLTVPHLQDPANYIAGKLSDNVSRSRWHLLKRAIHKVNAARKLDDGNYFSVKKIAPLHIPLFEKKVRSDGHRVVFQFLSFPLITVDIF